MPIQRMKPFLVGIVAGFVVAVMASLVLLSLFNQDHSETHESSKTRTEGAILPDEKKLGHRQCIANVQWGSTSQL